MGKVYTAERAGQFFQWSESVRQDLNQLFRTNKAPMVCNGLSSMFAIHFSDKPVTGIVARDDTRHALHKLLHMELLLGGILICTRGDLFLSLPLTNDQIGQLKSSLKQFIDRHRGLLNRISHDSNS